MVGNAGAFHEVWLGDANVEAPVEVPRIGVDHLGAEPLAEKDAKRRLPNCCWAADHDQAWFGRQFRGEWLQVVRLIHRPYYG
jgi:hypothetical protein